MMRETALFALAVPLSYLAAFLTSSAVVRWLLPQTFVAELSNTTRYVAIDGIRGYLALGVYLHHCLLTWVFLRTSGWVEPSHNFENELGEGSVAVFFMITAFLFWGRARASRFDPRNFAISRILRIYPLYVSVLLIIVLAVGLKSHWTAFESPLVIAKEIGGWLIFRAPDINRYARTYLIVGGVTWTLIYEAWFYLSLPFAVWVFLRENSIWTKAACVAIVSGLFMVSQLRFQTALSFLGGVLAVYWVASRDRTVLARGRAAALIGIACAIAVGLLLHDPFGIKGVVLLSVFFAVIASDNTFFGLLGTRGARWLGETSYSIYLCHGLLLWFVAQVVAHKFGGEHRSEDWLPALTIGLTPFVVLLSTITYITIERPLIAVGHRLANRGIKATVVAASAEAQAQ